MSTANLFDLDTSYFDLIDTLSMPHTTPGNWNVSELLPAARSTGMAHAALLSTAPAAPAPVDQPELLMSALSGYEAFPELQTMPKHWDLSGLD